MDDLKVGLLDLEKAIRNAVDSGGIWTLAREIDLLVDGYRELVATLLMHDGNTLQKLAKNDDRAISDFRHWCREPYYLCTHTQELDKVIDEYHADAGDILDRITKDWDNKWKEAEETHWKAR